MNILASLIVEIGAKLDPKGFKDAESATSNFATKAKDLLGKAFAVGAIVQFGKAAFDAYGIQEQAIAGVRAGLLSTQGVAGKTLDELIADAGELQKTSLFGDEQILGSVTQQLLTFTNIAGEQFSKTQQAAVDLAAKLGGPNANESSLQGATMMLGKALNDPVANLGALSRAGIQFSEDQKAMIKGLVETNDLAGAQNIILAEMETQFGGTAKAIAEAGSGPLKQAANQFGDILEVVGELIDAALKPLIKIASDVMSGILGLNEGLKKVVVGGGAAAVALGGIMLAFGPIPAAIAAVVGGVIVLIKNFDNIKDWFSTTFPAASKSFGKVWDEILLLVDSVKTYFMEFVADVKAIWAEWGDEIMVVVSGAFRHIGLVIDTVLSAVGALFRTWASFFRGDWQGMWNGIKDFFGGIWNGVLQIAINAIGSLIDLLDKIPGASSFLKPLEKGLMDLQKPFRDADRDARALAEGMAHLDGTTEDVAASTGGATGASAAFRAQMEGVGAAAKGAATEVDTLKKRIDELAKIEAVEIRGLDDLPVQDLKDMGAELRAAPGDLETYAGAIEDNLGSASKARVALATFVDAVAGNAEGSLVNAFGSKLSGAITDIFGDSGLGKLINAVVGGPLQNLISGFGTDLVNSLLGEGGLKGAFSSLFGEGGFIQNGFSGLFGEGGQLTQLMGIGGPMAAAILAVGAHVIGEWGKHLDTFVQTATDAWNELKANPLGSGGGPGSSPPTAEGANEQGQGSTLWQIVNAEIEKAFQAGEIYNANALLGLLSTRLAPNVWSEFQKLFSTPQDLFDWATGVVSGLESRMFGGPVTAGRMYETHGLGLREFFVPSRNGMIATGAQIEQMTAPAVPGMRSGRGGDVARQRIDAAGDLLADNGRQRPAGRNQQHRAIGQRAPRECVGEVVGNGQVDLARAVRELVAADRHGRLWSRGVQRRGRELHLRPRERGGVQAVHAPVPGDGRQGDGREGLHGRLQGLLRCGVRRLGQRVLLLVRWRQRLQPVRRRRRYSGHHARRCCHFSSARSSCICCISINVKKLIVCG